MIINLKVKTLDAQTHEFSIDNEITIKEFKDKISEKTSIAPDQQRIIYCGRVLADEKQLKEYDVDGKVVHVAERPPPSARQATSSASGSPGTGGNTSQTRRERSGEARGMRTSPLFRALDGMVVGAMAIPMNAGNNTQVGINPLTSSSSFCMNRITVARHMLDCANNIAAYLEDPERGLNNSSLDILAQGRWTMESTVVEVGITTSDLPANQNFVEALQGAVTAALRRSGSTNLTVVQLPTVFGSNEGEVGSDFVADHSIDANMSGSSDTAAPEPMDEGGVAIVIDTEESIDGAEDDNVEGADGSADLSSSSSTISSPLPATPAASAVGTSSGRNTPTTAAPGNTASGSRRADPFSETTSVRRTGTRVLAEVIQQMRTVQTRLNPFIEQYYDLLQNEPTFEENETNRREGAQRLFDRVSEAFHYMSHAQHAISDLMLDVSQPTPRHLCCRPILVEQSGYVSSNNFTPVFNASTPIANTGNASGSTSTAATAVAAGSSGTSAVAAGGRQREASGTSTPVSTPTATETVTTPTAATEDPMDEPTTSPSSGGTTAADTETTATVTSTPSNASTLDHHRLQVARMIQAVVNSAPVDSELRVQISAPSVLAFDNPRQRSSVTTASATTTENSSPNSSAPNAEERNVSSANTTTTAANTNTSSSTSSSDTNQARVTTATFPTTSTQTRSTSRPQVQVGNLPSAWNGRVIPANMMSSFDRFLPCNSHHIRDGEGSSARTPQNNNNNNNNNENRQEQHREQQQEMLREMFRRIITPRRPVAQVSPVGTAEAMPPLVPITAAALARNFARSGQQPTNITLLSPANTTAASAVTPPISRETTTDGTETSENSPINRDQVEIDILAANEDDEIDETFRYIELRLHLLNFVRHKIFGGIPITEENMSTAVNKAITWVLGNLTFLPQFDLPEYDSRDSVKNLVRHSLPAIINLINDPEGSPAEFERRLGELLEVLFNRLFCILFVCVGRINAELYWTQLMRILSVSLNANFRSDVLSFLQVYVNTQIPTVTANISDVQEYLVHRVTPMETDEDNINEQNISQEPPIQSTSRLTLEMQSPPPPSPPPTEPDEPLPAVIVGSETWHTNFPNNWLPIITRDIQRQRDAPSSQAPFSDAYISGMSAKRRKVIQNSKPPTDVKSLVSESVRRAIQSTGLNNSTASNHSQTPDEIAEAIGTDSSVQTSYCEALRSSVNDRLKSDPDYKPEKFPRTSKFLKK